MRRVSRATYVQSMLHVACRMSLVSRFVCCIDDGLHSISTLVHAGESGELTHGDA